MIRSLLMLCPMLLLTLPVSAGFVLYDASIELEANGNTTLSASTSGPSTYASILISSSSLGSGSFEFIADHFEMNLASVNSNAELNGQVNFGLPEALNLLAELDMEVTGQLAYAALLESDTGNLIWERVLESGTLVEELGQAFEPGPYTLTLIAKNDAQVNITFTATPIPEPAAVIILAGLPLALPLRRRTLIET